jgi:hypothetical protein
MDSSSKTNATLPLTDASVVQIRWGKPHLALASIWNWSKLQTPPSLAVWFPLYVFCFIVQGVLCLPVILSFRTFAFLDPGSGLVADRLVVRGFAPAIDFGYYHGLLPLMLDRLWFTIFGTGPQAYIAFRAVIAILSLIVFFLLFRCVQAPRIIYVMSCAAIPFVFFYRPSLNHDLAALGIAASLLLLLKQRYGAAGAAALLSAFCHPSLGYVMFAAVAITGAVAAWGSFPRLLRTALSMAIWSVGVLLVYFAASTLFFQSARPFLKTLLPLGGSAVRQHYHWSFLDGGLTFIHPAGSNWKYLVGSTAGSYLLFNLILIVTAIALFCFWRRYRLMTGAVVLFGCCFAIHAIYVLFVYGVPPTWAYDAYLLVLGLAAVPFARARHWLGVAMTAALLIGGYSTWSASRQLYPQARVGGLWIEEPLAADLAAIQQRQPEGKPYVWSMAGALSAIDAQVQSPQRWFVVPGANPPAELARLKSELLAKPVLFLYGAGGDPDYLFENPDFSHVRARFQEAERIGAFTVCVRRP